jgi:2-keto-3-deoxy-6-phosphogluconate aldolase
MGDVESQGARLDMSFGWLASRPAPPSGATVVGTGTVVAGVVTTAVVLAGTDPIVVPGATEAIVDSSDRA